VSQVFRCAPLIVAALVAGCATDAPLLTQQVAVERSQVAQFEMSGRLALGDDVRAAHVGIFWSGTEGANQVDFVSPLGQVLGRATWGRAPLSMQRPDGGVGRGAELEALMQREMGGVLPLESLRDWALGAPSGHSRVLALDAMGRPQKISEEGWMVEYRAYQSDAVDALPRLIDGRSGERFFRLSVTDWELKP